MSNKQIWSITFFLNNPIYISIAIHVLAGVIIFSLKRLNSMTIQLILIGDLAEI